MSLVTLEEALAHLRMTDLPLVDTADVTQKAEEASDIVLDYVTHEDKADWTDETAPFLVKAAVKLVLESLHDEGAMGDALSPNVKNILRRYRQPSLA